MKKLVIALLLPQVAGLVGSLYTFSAIGDWYQYLNKPSFNPPNWLFGPAWTILYILMGLAWYLADKKGAPKTLFLVHLVFNSIWSILFFGLKSPGLGLIGIAVLWGLIVALIRQFRSYDRTAAWLLVPYLLWVSFASVLNLSIYLLN